MALNKTQLIKQVASEAGLRNAEAEKAVKGVINAITNELIQKGSVSMIGFGNFSVAQRGERTGKNPRTGESIKIPEKLVVKFKPGKALAGAVMGQPAKTNGNKPAAKKAAPKKAGKK